MRLGLLCSRIKVYLKYSTFQIIKRLFLGKKEGKIDLKFDGSNELVITPQNFVLKQGERKEVQLKYT